MISFSKDKNIFHLETTNNSYNIEIYKGKYLRHIYWGRKIREINNYDQKFDYVPAFLTDSEYPTNVLLESISQEFGQEGSGDFRRPTISVYNETGRPYDVLEYNGHEIIKGKPEINGLPSARIIADDNVETLKLYLKDPESEIKIELLYTVYYDYDVITRSMNVTNCTGKKIDINSIMSFTLDLPSSNDGEQLELISLEGNWARERHIDRGPLRMGITSLSSNRGSSSHELNPFCALVNPSTDEGRGDVWSFSLIYSGNFLLEVEKTHTDMLRVTGGINPDTFNWVLEPGDKFSTPEAVFVYSDSGLNGMSKIYHKFYRERLIPLEFSDKERPVLINNWESTYFDFDHDKILSIVSKAKESGIELFVLDDGWFGERNGDKLGLGNWEVNEKKLVKGLEGLCEDINKEGLQFGLWVEPEMVNIDATIIKENPSWILGSYKKNPSQSRNQYVLDLVNPDVVDWLIETFVEIFSKTNIVYVKWDMNRYLTEQFSEFLPNNRKSETAHRYVLGLYRLMDALVKKYPKILFEGCSGGGGRFDAGMLYYMPQYWTSDNTDAIARLKIQYGTSLIYPLVTMGSHVSACPNHQLNRTTPMETRINVAMSGNLGFELDLNDTTDEELKLVKDAVQFYKENRRLIQFGEFYRLRSPFKGELTSWMFINEDRSEFIVFWFLNRAEICYSGQKLKLPYVNESLIYNCKDGSFFSGEELKYRGLELPLLDKDNASGYFYYSVKQS